MSLTVYAHYSSQDGAMGAYIPVESGRELFGFESCRTDLWGHAIMSHLALVLLPSLAETNIYAEGEESLSALEKDIHTVLAKLTEAAKATGYGEEFILWRCQNALGAINSARKFCGWVSIE